MTELVLGRKSSRWPNQQKYINLSSACFSKPPSFPPFSNTGQRSCFSPTRWTCEINPKDLSVPFWRSRLIIWLRGSTWNVDLWHGPIAQTGRRWCFLQRDNSLTCSLGTCVADVWVHIWFCFLPAEPCLDVGTHADWWASTVTSPWPTQQRRQHWVQGNLEALMPAAIP